jgi:hypothetical protein
VQNHLNLRQTARIEIAKYHTDLVVKTPHIIMDESIIPIQYGPGFPAVVICHSFTL